MPPKPFSGFSFMHRLVARCCLPGNTNWLAQFSRVFAVSDDGTFGVGFYDVCMIGMLCDYL